MRFLRHIILVIAFLLYQTENIAWDLAFLGDLQTTAIAHHGECISCLRDLQREFLVAALIEGRLIVQEQNIPQIQINILNPNPSENGLTLLKKI